MRRITDETNNKMGWIIKIACVSGPDTQKSQRGIHAEELLLSR